MTIAWFYTIKDSDVGKPILRAFGQVWLTVNFIGQILPIDVGKRVYRVAGRGESKTHSLAANVAL